MMATSGQIEKVGIAGSVNGFDVIVLGDTLVVGRGGETVTKRAVPSLGRFVGNARNLKLGCAKLPDFDVIYLYDAGGVAPV